MREINSKMLVLAREARGYTQKELCELLGITQGSLSKIEKGIQSSSVENIEKFCNVLKYPESFFYQQDNIYNPDLIYYRRRIAVKKKVLLKAEAKLNIVRMNIEKLLSSVELPEDNLFQWDVDKNGTPEEAAITLRQQWKIPKGRIDDLVKLIEDNGIIVIPFDFGADKFDGLSMYTTKNEPLIFYNSNMPGDRQRLTIAHELGHLIMHFGRIIDIERDVEKEAMKFASELLVPEKEFKSTIVSFDLRTLANLKLYWRVSMGSLLYRCKALDMITDNQYRYLWQQMSMLGYKTKEPKELEVISETPTLLTEIIEKYSDELEYSKSEIAGLLNINEDDLQEMYFKKETRFKIIRN
jgi:Zn-dependent peptidase ImmA (M78 family)/DNA-binding XRE family transcriptional regulator